MRRDAACVFWQHWYVRWLVLIVLMGCADQQSVDERERARLLTLPPVWTAAARAERCPRPALRAPVTGDGSPRLHVLYDNNSPEVRCLERVKELRTELGPCLPEEHCGPQTLATIKPHTDIVEACAPLYAVVEELAHASEACSPTGDDDSVVPDGALAFFSLSNAVRIEVAPYAASGQLGEASARVLDAIRFADDFGRKGTVLGAEFSTKVASRLVDTLDELAIDPRLTADEARTIARDLDTLLASAPRWDAIMREDQVWTANFAVSHSPDAVPLLAILEAQRRDIRRVCSGTLRDCVEHLDDVKDDHAADFKDYAQHLAQRDSGLAFVRMQIELRLARPEDCADPVRRRAILQPWAGRAVVGDEREPIVTPPAWERAAADRPRSVPRVLRCVPALP